MGDPDHLAKFGEGAKAWNAWRAARPGTTPDLRGMSPVLGQKQLGPAHGGPIDLSDAFLNGANLHSATLIEARLDNADLRHANLSLALLSGADLSVANLSFAVLDHADLGGVSLHGAILEGAKLDLARNLTQAQIDEAFGNAQTLLPADLRVPETWSAPERFADEDLPLDHEDAYQQPTPYEVLGLAPNASTEEVRAAYRRLVKKFHPDLNPGDLIAERRFKKISEAHRMLTAPPPVYTEPPRRRSRASWTVAMCIFFAAFVGPSAAIYWMGWPPFRPEAEQAERIQKSPDRLVASKAGDWDTKVTVAVTEPPALAVAEPQPAPPTLAVAEPQPASLQPEPPAPAAAPVSPEPAAAPATPASPAPSGIAEIRDLVEGERIKTAAELGWAHEPAALDASKPSLWPSAEAQHAPPIKAEATGGAPWPAEGTAPQGTIALTPLQSFVLRHREKLAALQPRNDPDLQSFVQEAVENAPLKAPAQQQLALLVDRESTEDDKKAWDETRERGTAAALRAYLMNFPNGRYVASAEDRLADIEEKASGRKKDTAAWNRAVRIGTPAGYEAYLRDYPNGRQAEEARRKVVSLLAARATAQKESGALEKVNKGRYAASTREALNAAEEAPEPPQASPPRSVPDTARGRKSSGPRFPSPDEPFDRLQGSAH